MFKFYLCYVFTFNLIPSCGLDLLQLVAVAASYDGRYLFSAGGPITHMWQVNAPLLAASAHLNGLGIEVFFDMVEGERR